MKDMIMMAFGLEKELYPATLHAADRMIDPPRDSYDARSTVQQSSVRS